MGTTVKWTNEGGAAHTATSDSGTWDSGQLAGAYNGPYGGYSGGGGYQYTFTAAGTYAYHCSIHPPSVYPDFTGTITVSP
jgi:plastocyanin